MKLSNDSLRMRRIVRSHRGFARTRNDISKNKEVLTEKDWANINRGISGELLKLTGVEKNNISVERVLIGSQTRKVFYSLELCIWLDNTKCKITRVSYTGINSDISSKMKNVVEDREGYLFKKSDTGFEISLV